MIELSTVIVGAGFSGLCAGILLRHQGIDSFVILDKADRVGGTWRDNTYPGAACDVPSHLYSYSFEPNPNWSRSYGQQPEILAYLERCVQRYGLAKHLRLGQTVVRAEWHDDAGRWHLTCADGTIYAARSFVLAAGALHVPQLPNIAGIDSFRGTTFHSARWDHSYDLHGKRVAVIGTGASAIQLVPEIAPVVDRLHVFQRTPPWIVPKNDRLISARERWIYANVPGAHWLRRASEYWRLESRVVGFAYAPRVNQLLEQLVKRFIAMQVRDRELRAKLTPSYRFGCKRVLISNDFYPALQRPNVDLVTESIEAIVPEGVKTASGVREVDAIIMGTGFSVTEHLSAIEIVGRDGVRLDDAWKSSLRNYLGITVSGFPNLFMLLGPNTGLGHNSIVFMIEAQTRYAVSAIRTLLDRDLRSIDVRPSVEAAFRAELARKMKNTVWATGCSSWYQTADGEVFLWPAASVDYWWRTRTLDLEDFDVTSNVRSAHVDETAEGATRQRGDGARKVPSGSTSTAS